MQNVPVFKKRYLLLLILLTAIICIGYKAIHFSPLEQQLFRKVPVNNLVNLYVTEASAGATTDFSYRFFLYDAKKNDADFTAHMNEEIPFMITNDKATKIRVTDGQVYLKVQGDLYSFRNTNYFTRVHLTASP